MRPMRTSYPIASLIIVIAITGCAEPFVGPTSSCQAQCTQDQACINNMCYDTCSQNKPCKDFNATCQNNICVAKDAECTPNTRKCHTDKKTVMLCKDGTFYTPEKVCGAAQTCDMGVCVETACENGTKRCRNNNVEICKNSAFRVYTECELPQICQEKTLECEEPAECSGDAKKCDENGNIVACIDKHWKPYQTCADGYACDATSKTCVETASCEPGSVKCNGNHVIQCIQNHWQKMGECNTTEICRQGRCVKAACENGETRCAEVGSLSYIETCHNSEFYASSQCMSGEVCIMENDEAKCAQNQCSSLYKCINNALHKCALTDYELHETCATGTYCDAVAGACLPNCGNHIVDAGEDCDGLTFRDGVSCSSTVTNSVGTLKCTKDCKLDASGCTVACESGSTSCNGDVFTACIGGSWETTNCADKGQKCSTTGCYTPSYDGTWDHIQDFESLPNSATAADRYTAILEFDQNGIHYKMQGRRDMDNKGIDGNGLIMRKDDNAANYIHIEQIPKGVQKIAFSWRSWGGSKDKGDISIQVGSLKTTLNFTNVTTSQPYELDVNDASANTILIQSTNSARFIIDNLRWTNM